MLNFQVATFVRLKNHPRYLTLFGYSWLATLPKHLSVKGPLSIARFCDPELPFGGFIRLQGEKNCPCLHGLKEILFNVCFFPTKVYVPAGDDTVPETHMAMETPFFGWYLLGKIRIFHCYVSLREMIDSQFVAEFGDLFGGLGAVLQFPHHRLWWGCHPIGS